MIQVRYDPSVDALAIEFVPGARSARSRTVAEGVTCDFDAEGRLVTVELLDASWHVGRDAVTRLPTAPALPA